MYTNWANSQPMMGGLTYCTYSATEAGNVVALNLTLSSSVFSES